MTVEQDKFVDADSELHVCDILWRIRDGNYAENIRIVVVHVVKAL